MMRRCFLLLVLVVIASFVTTTVLPAVGVTMTPGAPNTVAFIILFVGLALTAYLAWYKNELDRVWRILFRAILELAQGYLRDVTEEEVHAIAGYIYDKYVPGLVKLWLDRDTFCGWGWAMWQGFLDEWEKWLNDMPVQDIAAHKLTVPETLNRLDQYMHTAPARASP